MCDTILATPASTANRIMLFGKNSDRQRNEAQAVELVPAADHGDGTSLQCTYIAIPQVRHTHAVLLSKPFWIWGAEMGANEHGVVIGNEGLHAKSPPPEEKALIGMDLLRLGLERGATAAEAVEVITSLLERFGQGGNCGHLTPSFYNNSFMVADPTEAFVIETVGREWLVERARGVRTISNDYSITKDVERRSEGLPGLLRDFGWKDGVPPSYADVIANQERQHIGQSCDRRLRGTGLLSARAGKLDVSDIMRTLRDHDPDGKPASEWSVHSTRHSLCIHAKAGPGSQTTGALASEIRRKDSVHWITATSAPCISVFKPVLMDQPLPGRGPTLTDRYDQKTLWWRHEKLHRTALLGNFAQFMAEVSAERDALEADFRARMSDVLAGGSAAERARVVAACWKEADELEARWFSRLPKTLAVESSPYHDAWAEMNKIAGLELV